MRFCPYNLSLTLQSLGYDGEYNYCWIETQHDGLQLMTLSDCEKYRHDISPRCAAPRLDDAAYFLRDKYGINIVILMTEDDKENPIFYHLIQLHEKDGRCYCRTEVEEEEITPKHYVYDDTLEAAVTKAIEIIKNS